MMAFRPWLLPSLAPLLLMVACASTPPPRLYVLGDPAEPAQAMKVQSGRPVVRLLPVSVPEYLDTREILHRDRSNEVTASSTGLWAERLSVGVTDALAGSLAIHLPELVIVTGQPAVPPSRQILVDVLEFEIGADGRCLLNARWESVSGDGSKVLRRESDSLVEQAAQVSDASVAEAMTRAINRLALRIVATARSWEFMNSADNDTTARGRPGL